MNCKKHILATVITATFSTATVQAASNGIINFTGEIVDRTCDITVDGNVSPATVTLPAVQKSLLASSGQTTARTGFNIKLSNCSGTASVAPGATDKATTFFENGATIDPVNYRLNNTLNDGTQASNVQLQLIDAANGNMIKVGSPEQITSTTAWDLSSGSATLPYAVEYYATGTATPGFVQSSVNFTINYI